MTKRQLKREAYRRIVREGASHQVAYESLKDEAGMTREDIAEELSKIPSKSRLRANRLWVGLFITLLAVIIVFRIAGIFLAGLMEHFNTPALLFLILLGIVIPVMSIVLVAQSRWEGFPFISLLFVLSIFRSVQQMDVSDPVNLVGLIPYFGVIILGFWIPIRLKTPYKQMVGIERGPDGAERKIIRIVFEDNLVSGDDDLPDTAI